MSQSHSMALWQKIIHASPGRKTRFHTERGEVMPADAWLRLPLTLIERVIAADKERPWIVPSAIGALERMVRKEWRVLEVGAGASTLWWAKRVSHLTSLETDAGWHRELELKLDTDLRLVSPDSLLAEMKSLPEGSFDIVVVDNSGDRMGPLSLAALLARAGGWIMLDNSDRYAQADRVLSGWSVRRFVGVPPKPLTAQETSLYQKPWVSRPSQ